MVRIPAVLKSVFFHIAVVLAFTVSLPFLTRDIAPEQPTLTVDIVNTVPETNLDEGIETKVDPKASDSETDESNTPPPAPAPPPPPPPEVAEVAESLPEPDIESEPLTTPKPEAESKPVKAPPKRPIKKSPEFKKRQQEQAALTSKLQDLTERQAQLKREREDKEEKKKAAEDKIKKQLENKEKKDKEDAERIEAQEKLDQLVGQALNAPRRTSSALGASTLDQLRNHLAQNWNPPAGASGADALIVDIIVRLNQRAEVKEVLIVDEARMASDTTFRAAARAARSAVIASSPLPLPLNDYDKWKELQFEFNPSFITRN